MKIESIDVSGHYFPVQITNATLEEIERLEESIADWRKKNVG